MDPITDVTIVKSLGKKLYEIFKNLKDREIKNKVDEVLDELRDLKQQASDLEDENRSLSEKLRFKGDDFEFRNPFHYEKKHSDRPLCAKCFAKEVIAAMSEPYAASGGMWRCCLVCENRVEIKHFPEGHIPGPSSAGPSSWMGD